MDAAVVEDQVDAGKLLPRLLWLHVQLYYTLVTYRKWQNTILSMHLPFQQSSYISIVHSLYYHIKLVYEKCLKHPGSHPEHVFGNVNSLILGVTCQFLYHWHFGVSAEKSAETEAQSIELVEELLRSGQNGSTVHVYLWLLSSKFR